MVGASAVPGAWLASTLFPLFLVSPVALDSFLKQGEGHVFCGSTGAPKFFNHSHGAIGIARVDENGGSGLKLRVRGQPRSDSVSGARVVTAVGVVMFGMKIVIEEDGVVRV